MHLFAAGRFDRIEDVEWSKYGREHIASALHTQVPAASSPAHAHAAAGGPFVHPA